MWKRFENIGLQTSEKVSWEKNKKETCAKRKIDRSQNWRSNDFGQDLRSGEGLLRAVYVPNLPVQRNLIDNEGRGT